MPAALTHPAGTEPDCKSKSNSSITFRVPRNLPANGFGFKQKLEAQTSTTVPRSHVQKGSYASLPREDMPFAHHYSLQNKKLYHHTVVQSVQDELLLRKKPTCTMASATVLALHRKAANLSLFQEPLFASQPLSATLPTSATCSAFPALASAAAALGSQKTAPSSEPRGLQPPRRHHQARLAAMLMHRGVMDIAAQN